jgi:hypothetical protein
VTFVALLKLTVSTYVYVARLPSKTGTELVDFDISCNLSVKLLPE